MGIDMEKDWREAFNPQMDPREAKELHEKLDAIWNYLPEETDEEDWQPSREEFLSLLEFISARAGLPALWNTIGRWADPKREG